MKKIVLVFLTVVSASFAIAQQTPTKKDFSKINLDRAGDHLMLQFSSDQWAGIPDSIQTNKKGFSRGLNAYVMLDRRFKTNPFWSIAFGLGISSSSVFFKNMGPAPYGIGVGASANQTLSFSSTTGEHYKKYKLATTYLELPVELRYTANPADENQSWKVAFGVKLGVLLNAHTKGKTLLDFNGATINNGAIEKESSTRYFNATRVAATARIGYGHYSLFGSYSITGFLKDGSADLHPYQIGITLSGL
jgi:Outer membrane protein beta-barrel domain